MGGKFRQLSLNRLHFVNFLLLLLIYQFQEAISSVSYDRKAIIINGKRRILFSGSIHYPRSVPEMWPDLIQKAKDGGLDVIQTYVFWSGHEPSSGKYNFEGRYDLVRFIKLVKQAGLYVHLRIGPYICAEWNFGGFPVWLKYVPGISFRTDNHPFKVAMRGFTEKIVDMMKAEGLFQWQGGPIIMSQIENEYGPVEYEIGAPGQAYTHWAAKMAVGLGTGVPWVMCKQDDVPDPVIDTCNGFYCENFLPSKPYKPKIWTEAWTGWFSGYGEPVPHRPVEDLAFAVAKFIQKGGSFVNYYMYHGGTNFGRTAGGKFVTTSYDYDAPIDEYGLLREPKWSHLRDLHKVIKLCEPALISGDPTIMPLGNYQEAHVFKTKSGDCAAFLANYNPNSFARVAFQDMHYNLPPWSISILPDCKITIFNTARVNSQTSLMKMASVDSSMSSWQSSNEEITSYDSRLFTALGLLEQMNTTRDSTDYLWYMTDVDIDPDELFLKNGQYPILSISSAGHTLQVFINEEYIGSASGSLENPNIIFTGNAKMKAGINRISILSSSVGLPNEGIHYETWNAGVLGPVMLNGLNEGRRDLSWQKWTYKIGLNGEAFNLKSQTETPSIEWVEGSLLSPNQPLTWYKNYFDAPSGEDPLALDMGGMGKGQAWINGNNIGRYWPAYMSSGSCGDCNYTGTHNEKRCLTNCGEPSQRWYHVPRSWLKPKGNLLVVFEEWGGDPTSITLVKRTIGSVCANVHEWQPTLEDWKNPSHWKLQGPQRPTINLWCSPGRKISSIKFASFGTPEGECGNFQQGSCHAFHSYDTFEKNCIGQQWCNVTVSPEAFGGDPCPNIMKKLAVEALCE